ncbi:MAG TPA: 4Fe-4S dicluster domain-containing protein [Methanofastidiosum sp.]|nr:4Fe-4S dicluster domain-containing protein [Methanofastidiosum sp.]
MKISNDCMSCGLCSEVCPAGAIAIKKRSDSSGYAQYTIDEDTCTNCGTCILTVDCPSGALRKY